MQVISPGPGASVFERASLLSPPSVPSLQNWLRFTFLSPLAKSNQLVDVLGSKQCKVEFLIVVNCLKVNSSQTL